MNGITILIMSAALAMDAFAVSICKGLAMKKASAKAMISCALWFGIFQGAMPVIGYFLGSLVVGSIETYSSWIAFGLLELIGVNMIREAGEEEDVDSSLKPMEMFVLAIATSIDALAVGVSFSMAPVNMIASLSPLANTMLACLEIAVVTGIFCAAGVRIGSLAGAKFQKRAKLAGGIVLILIGLRILLSHYGVF